jgi:3-hydroxybutyryl-CoA dehydrogenase
MRILILGTETDNRDCRAKFGDHEYCFVTSYQDAASNLAGVEVLFDFLADPALADQYLAGFPNVVFFNTTKVTLAEFVRLAPKNATRFGFNGMTGFILLPILEVCLADPQALDTLSMITKKLGTEFCVVGDRIGMVTSRIICMIINEAFYTVQEGTATREDVDLAMKLGTHYPYGPFEWCQRIGIRDVYELLEKIHNDTRNSRYTISPLLKKECLESI